MIGSRTAQAELSRRYRFALAEFEAPSVRRAASTLGMGAREYCEYYVQAHYPPLLWVASTANAAIGGTDLDSERAWHDALAAHEAVRAERPASRAVPQRRPVPMRRVKLA